MLNLFKILPSDEKYARHGLVVIIFNGLYIQIMVSFPSQWTKN